jgi:hypothetical protein
LRLSVVWWKCADVSEAVYTSKTQVNLYKFTKRNISEDSHLHVFSTLKTEVETLWFDAVGWLTDAEVVGEYSGNRPIYHFEVLRLFVVTVLK